MYSSEHILIRGVFTRIGYKKKTVWLILLAYRTYIMANQWFKFYGGEYLSDPKIERLSPIERSCWITILCMASMGADGVIEYLTVESLLNRSGIQFDPYHPEEWEKALGVLVKFKNLKMIDCKDDGTIIVLNWEKRQEHALTPAERMAKMRAKAKENKDKEAVSYENVTKPVTNVTLEENRIEENREEKKIQIPTELPSKEASDSKPKRKKIQNTDPEEIPPFESSSWVSSLLDSPQLHINLIGSYFLKYADHNFPTKEVASAELKKNLKPAMYLVKNFRGEDITKTLRHCQDNFSDINWNLHTVQKQITHVTAKK